MYPLSIEQWEDGFDGDLHPEREIALRSRIASVYSRLAADGGLDAARKKDIFQVLVACATNLPDNLLDTVSLKSLSWQEVQRVVPAFHAHVESPSTHP